MLLLYNSVLIPFRAASAVWAAWSTRDPERAAEWRERRARVLPSVRPGGFWIHGASVGEARIVRALAAALRNRRPELPLCASALTRTGRNTLPCAPEVDASFFAPLDFPAFQRRLLDAVRPAALVLVETELWPNLLHEAARRGVAVALANARLAPERMPRYRRLSGLYRPLLRTVAVAGAQSEGDASRLVALGVRPEALTVTGNLKYDLAPPDVDPSALRRRFGLEPGRPVVVAGSTGSGEEPSVLDAFVRARSEHPELYLVLAPRHPQRAESAGREAVARGLRMHRLSALADHAASGADGLLVDTVGELGRLYALGDVAFVGGSLVPVGGHNLLEPAALGVPVLFGPHTEHVAQSAHDLERAGGGLRVSDAESLARTWISLLRDERGRRRMSERAFAVLSNNRGALERTVDLLLEIVAPPASAGTAKSP